METKVKSGKTIGALVQDILRDSGRPMLSREIQNQYRLRGGSRPSSSVDSIALGAVK